MQHEIIQLLSRSVLDLVLETKERAGVLFGWDMQTQIATSQSAGARIVTKYLLFCYDISLPLAEGLRYNSRDRAHPENRMLAASGEGSWRSPGEKCPHTSRLFLSTIKPSYLPLIRMLAASVLFW